MKCSRIYYAGGCLVVNTAVAPLGNEVDFKGVVLAYVYLVASAQKFQEDDVFQDMPYILARTTR